MNKIYLWGIIVAVTMLTITYLRIRINLRLLELCMEFHTTKLICPWTVEWGI